MTDSTQRFITELIGAANEIDRLAMSERANLLRRAAATIHNLRDGIGCNEMPAKDLGAPDDIVFCLNELAGSVDYAPSDHVADALMEAVGTIKAALVLLDEKGKIERRE